MTGHIRRCCCITNCSGMYEVCQAAAPEICLHVEGGTFYFTNVAGVDPGFCSGCTFAATDIPMSAATFTGWIGVNGVDINCVFEGFCNPEGKVLWGDIGCGAFVDGPRWVIKVLVGYNALGSAYGTLWWRATEIGGCPWEREYEFLGVIDTPPVGGGEHIEVTVPPAVSVSAEPCASACWIICPPCDGQGEGIDPVVVACDNPVFAISESVLSTFRDPDTQLCYTFDPDGEQINSSSGYVIVTTPQIVEDGCEACLATQCVRRLESCGCPGTGSEVLGPVIWGDCDAFTAGTPYLIRGSCFTATATTKQHIDPGDQYIPPPYGPEYADCDECCVANPPPPPPGDCPEHCTNCPGTISVAIQGWTQTIFPGCSVAHGSDVIPLVKDGDADACSWASPDCGEYDPHTLQVSCPDPEAPGEEWYTAVLSCFDSDSGAPFPGWLVHINTGCGPGGPGPSYLSQEGGYCPPSGTYIRVDYPGDPPEIAQWPSTIFVAS